MRDLQADLEICNKATPGPWIQDRCNVSAQGYTLFITYVSGKNDAQFIADARKGWPEAITRAINAEAEVERLRKELDKYKRAYAEICHQFNFGDESDYRAMYDYWLDWAEIEYMKNKIKKVIEILAKEGER